MNIGDYYRGAFREDLDTFTGKGVQFGNDIRHYFGHTWHYDCRGLDKVPEARRPEFLLCLYFTVLVDQAMYEYYPNQYEQFRTLTRYPKFCFGLGQFQLDPYAILSEPISQNKIAAESIWKLLEEAMTLFVDEVEIFCRDHMPKIDAEDFFRKLIKDPDVVPHSDSNEVCGKVFLALSSAIRK